jgi:hypothetical protein
VQASATAGGRLIAPGELLVRTLRDLEDANRQLVALLKARKALREARYDYTPAEYATRVAQLQDQIDGAIAQVQALHQLVRDIRE